MKHDEFLQKLTDKSNLQDTEEVLIEWPGLCGNSNVGTKRCQHGHMTISVTPDTVRDVAFEETHRIILLVIPKTLIKRILPPVEDKFYTLPNLEKELKSE